MDFARSESTGELFVFDQNIGDWRPASSMDVELQQAPMLRGATTLAQGLSGGMVGMGSPGLDQASRNANPMTISGLELATMGGAGLGLVGAGLSGLRGAARAGAPRMVQRVESSIAGAAPGIRPSPMQVTMTEQIETVADAVNAFGADSVGAAAQGGVWDFLKSTPGLRGTLEGLEEFVGAVRPLTRDQQKLIASGNAERLGFRWMPGQRNGNGVISDIIRSQPFMADLLDPLMSANADNYAAKIASALRISVDDVGKNIVGAGERALGRQFDEVAEGIPTVAIDGDVAKVLDDLVLTPAERAAYGVGDDVALRASGRDVMELRKKLANEMAVRARNEGQDKVYRTMSQAMEELDRIVDDALEASGDTVTRQLWGDAKLRWRVLRATDRAGVVQPDGSISLKSMANALEREFENEFRKSLFAPEGMTADVRDLLDLTRIARAFESNLGDSGTATRSAITELMKNPGLYAKQRVAAKFLTDVVLNDPQRAASMAQ